MEKLSVNGEINSFGVNKLINEILNSNGHYEESISGSDLEHTKFSILVDPKKDYGIAYLKLKFREKNLDFDNLEAKQDLSKLQHDGISKVMISFSLKPYQKREVSIHDLQGEEKMQYAVLQLEIAKQSGNTEMINYWQATIENMMRMQSVEHPYSKTLKELERQKREAQALGDDVGVNYYQSNIVEVVKNHPYEITPEEWDSFDIEQRKNYILIKMKEAKILGDIDAFHYWQANLEHQESLKNGDNFKR